MAEKEYTWDEDDVVTDHTRKVKKVWDNLIPESYPHVTGFDTIGVKWVESVEKMGPYSMPDHKLKYKVIVKLDSQPLLDSGWTRDIKLTWELFKKGYGEDFDYELRNLMRSLLPYVNLGHVGHFDFRGDITYHL